MSEVHGPWEQAENSDYDEQKPSSGDSHEDEFDDEYGEQRPHGDPDRPDNSLEDAYQADIEYWEEVARLNALAKPYDPDVKVTSDAAALNDLARPYDPDAPVTSDAPAAESYQPVIVDPGVSYGDAVGDSDSISLSSQLNPADEFVVDDSYDAVADSLSSTPEVEYPPELTEQTDWNHFIG